MQMNDYQFETRNTAKYKKTVKDPLSYLALGLAGEAGEVANKIKKVLRDDYGYLTDEKKAELLEELGDVMWYLAQMIDHLDSSMASVASKNLVKLNLRYASGEDERLT